MKRAFAEGLVHVEDTEDDDVASYFRRVERGWRGSTREGGITRLAILPTTVDDLLRYGEDHGRDPKDQQTLWDAETGFGGLDLRLRGGSMAG